MFLPLKDYRLGEQPTCSLGDKTAQGQGASTSRSRAAMFRGLHRINVDWAGNFNTPFPERRNRCPNPKIALITVAGAGLNRVVPVALMADG